MVVVVVNVEHEHAVAEQVFVPSFVLYILHYVVFPASVVVVVNDAVGFPPCRQWAESYVLWC